MSLYVPGIDIIVRSLQQYVPVPGEQYVQQIHSAPVYADTREDLLYEVH